MPYKVLIADDEISIAESLGSLDYWDEQGIEVVGTASDGNEVLEWLKFTDIDIIITDIQMPGMNGLKLLAYLDEHFPDIHVIVISGYSEFSYAHAALKYNAVAYILKPIDTDELTEAVDNIIQKLNQQQETNQTQHQIPHTYHGAIVKQSVEFMRKNLDKELTLQSVAKEVHLTPQYFGQVFKSVTEETFLSYLTRLRMHHASQKLKNLNLTINQIGASIGYKDPKYFSKVFYKTYAMTPSEFRKKQ